ncbi:MAG: NADH-quinone oxidoreductase subunit M [Planctomycetota bacterium]
MQTQLILTILLPLATAVLLLFMRNASRETVRWTALLVTIATLVSSVMLASTSLRVAPDGAAFAVTSAEWLPPASGIDVRFHFGLDGLSLWLFVLSSVLMFTSVLVSWEAIQERAALFYGMLMLLTAGCLGVFAARDLLLFYIFFEFTLIPLFFLIGIWGSEDRRHAAMKFFIFTLTGSLLTFLGLLTIVFWCRSQVGGPLNFSIPVLTAELAQVPMPVTLQTVVFLALFAGFAIKVPLFPLHTWLPLAHVQAPTAGSVFLAGILLKIGTYGFVRFSIPMLPDATVQCAPWLIWLSVIGILYGALVALAQSDIKRLIAYSSVSHLGFCMLGLFALNSLGTQGSVLQMVNHGISTGALFALVGMVYERYHTRQIASLGGLTRELPILGFFMVLFTFSSIGLPGLNGFAGEIMILLGMFERAFAEGLGDWTASLKVASILSITGVVLGAWYMLWLVQRVFFGPRKTPPGETASDLGFREIVALIPLAVLVFWIGLYPQFFLRPLQKPVDELTARARVVAAEQNLDAAGDVAIVATLGTGS